MPRFAANLSFLYPELEFLQRFEAAARDGFKGVEYLFPYPWPVHELAARLQDNGLQQVLFNAPAAGADSASVAGAWQAGARGLLCLAHRQPEFEYGLKLALDYAVALHCPRIHVMAGLLPQGMQRSALWERVIKRLRWACQRAADQGITLLIEPINQRDMPGYYLSRQDQALAILQAVGAANLQLQMDLYHCQINEGDLSHKLRRDVQSGHIGHIQIAGVPTRQEPDQGELNAPYLLALLDELGYSGWVGCEYHPRLGRQPGGTSAGLGWCAPWLSGTAPRQPG